MGKFAGIYEYVRAKYADRLRDLSPSAREAAIFGLSLAEMPLEWRPDDRFAGWFGFDAPPAFTPVADFCPSRFATEEAAKAYEHFISSYMICPNIDRAHTCAAYETILNKGLSWYADRIEAGLREHPEDETLMAMLSALKGVQTFCLRLSEKLEKQSADADKTTADRMRRAADALKRVPWQPAEDLLDALQSIWIIHFLIPLAENAWYSISLGRFDQYVYPFYRKAVADGVPADEINAMLHELFLLLNSYADAAGTLNLGGADADGREMYNEFSFLLLDLEKQWRFPGPIFTARVSAATTDDTMEKLVDPALFTVGQPTFYGEENCRAALIHRGVPAEDAVGFACNSCMGIAVPGQECNNMWGCVFNTSLMVELAVNGGKTLDGEQVIDPADLPEITDIDTLFDAVMICAKQMMTKGLGYYEDWADYVERYHPDPFFSAITDDCIALRKDRLGGARYHNATVETFGLVDAADALCAIDTLVFREKTYTLEQLTAAVRADYQNDPALFAAVTACPQYGTNDPYADGMALRLSNAMTALVDGFSHGNRYFLPSLHTLDTNVAWGKNWRATYNGRRAGRPFAKNAGPQNNVRCKECTSLVISAGKLPQDHFSGGQPIDLHFCVKDLQSREDKLKIAALIRTYFKMNGLQLQVNSLSVEQLEAAYAHPEEHGDLVVRIGGFSVYFNWLTDDSKKEFIERFRKEEV